QPAPPESTGAAEQVVLLVPRDLTPEAAQRVVLRAAELAGRPGRLTIATERAQPVLPQDPADPGPAALRALVRVLAFEHPEARARLVDHDDLRDLATELTNEDTREDEVAWRAGTRYVARLRRTELPPARTTQVAGPGAYVITGGSGRLGLIAARWLAERGATRVILNARRPAAPPGPVTEVITGDLSAPGTAERLVAAATADGVRLRGVIHAAGVLDDRLIADLDRDSLERVWAAKVTGALRLHEATRHLDLDWWVAFSSAAALLGSPGQAAYATANAWLDALCAHRRSLGLPATAIGWGAWTGATPLPAMRPLTQDEGVEALEALIQRDLSAGVIRLDPAQAVRLFPAIGRIPFFAEVAEPAGESLPDLAALPPDAAMAALTAQVRDRAAAVLGLDPVWLDEGSVLTDLGLDSLAATRLRGTVEYDFGVTVPTGPLLKGGTLGELAEAVAAALGVEGAERPALVIGPRDAAERQVARVLTGLLGRPPSVTERIDPRLLPMALDLLERETGSRVQAADPTVAELADAIRQADESAAERGVVRPLTPGRSGAPLFLAHPAGGTTGVYALLAARLDVPVLGLERLEEAETLGIPERAARYAEAVAATGPGPYRLGGWSFGGLLAFEIARRLGDEVELVAMIDSGLPAQVGDDDRRAIHAGRYVDFAGYLRETYGVPVRLDLDELLDLDEQRQLALAEARIAESGVLGMLSPAILRHQITSHEDTRAIERYRPGPYGGRVVLYRSTEPTPWAVSDARYAHEDDPARGFTPYSANLEIVEVPGSHHLNLLDPPHIEVIAEHLKGLL
ncbi:SDR family oxidoreductase, partial [Nonomuraea sp. NN258]|uniref:SDR family oxidoreductase n=1 Tax=Nonomuraea antri TaxID=2730852 RepID=UPI001569E410